MPDIYDELAARFLGENRYVFPVSRRCRVSGTAAVLDKSTVVTLVDELAVIAGQLSGDDRFRDTMDWYRRGTHERAAASPAPPAVAAEPVPEPEALPGDHHRPGRVVRVSPGFLAAGVSGIPPADLPTLVAPLPVIVEEP